ncbi:hydroxypyruvate isomerase [Mycobacterium saskatchewanense]|uniref:Hydroxypyruvate isomerase n=1 Tax=Mycobacterium saskatchewanense TaxID=220927 RepID=A0AAJ3NL69_9MYCO|nr:TIM barrel protein [Mycobacterium saskatchewanense]ORW66488.1 hydroxypyruvate isomerase [Mycobacterium saskatchewanense]BBX65761.1 hydroxypyruvate isomerase [Mycobacterium saskatchewanense]
MASATYTVNCSILFTDLPVLDRPAAAREAGFEAVEFWWPFPEPTPSDADVDAFVRAIRDAGVQLSGLNFAAGDMAEGDRGILSNPAYVKVFRDNVSIAVGIAEALGTKAFNALYGNRIAGVADVIQDDVAADNLAYAARAVQPIGATVLVEPVSGAPRYPIKSLADAVKVVDRAGEGNLRVLADLYHLYVNGDDVTGALGAYADRVGHVQIADAPGRGEPGTGQIPLGSYLAMLLDRGYGGYIGLEYKATTPDPFDWLPRAERGRGGVDTSSLAALAGTREQ